MMRTSTPIRAIDLRRNIWGWRWLLVLGGAWGYAHTATFVIGNQGSCVLSRAFTFLEDGSASLTVADILKPDAQDRFAPVGRRARIGGQGREWAVTVFRSSPGCLLPVCQDYCVNGLAGVLAL